MHRKRLPKDLIVRRLHTKNQDDVCDHFLRLDPYSRRARFCGAVSSKGVLNYVQKIFSYDCVVCGAFVGRQLRGVVELRGLFHPFPSTTEAAFSVERDWQNIVIGDVLFDRILAMAQNRGVRTIQMMCMKENSRMQHLLTKHHARIIFDHDTVEAVLFPNWPTPKSLAKEIIGETEGYSIQLFR